MPSGQFKFLDAYEKEDFHRFFGREEETTALYDMSYDTRLLLVYGLSGTGKTSIIRCGLANKFSDTRWQGLYIRRGDDLLASLRTSITTALKENGLAGISLPEEPVEWVKLLERLLFKPIFLLFDQFEELFILNPKEEEQQAFFDFLSALMRAESNSRVVLIMREEFIAQLWQYEPVVPGLFDYRYRIEKMRKRNLQEVIEQTLGQLEEVVVEEGLPSKILKKIQPGQGSVELAHLQVYLDQLYEKALAQRPPSATTIPFSKELVEAAGEMQDVIGQFLEQNLKGLEKEVGPHIPIRVLSKLVSTEHTKLVLQLEDFRQEVMDDLGLEKAQVQACLDTFQKMRIIRLYEE